MAFVLAGSRVGRCAMTEREPRRGGNEVTSRKLEHIELARQDGDGAVGAGWSDVELLHVALPEIDFDEVDLGTPFLGHSLSAPLAIAGMTGGHPDARSINATLAAAAERHGIAIGVGSQRAALLAPEVAGTYAVVREVAPTTFVIANIGAAQLIPQGGAEAPIGPSEARRLVEMVGADALAVHLNFLEEAVQPEGDRRARGAERALARLVEALGDLPVIAKETGAGISADVAARLAAIGVRAIDVGGRGGTSFAGIEARRAERRGEWTRARLGESFRAWGLPTAVAVAAVAESGLQTVATGGLRSGLDAAKAIALGATVGSVGRPLLEAALEGEEALELWIESALLELRTALFLTGSASPAALADRGALLLGEVREWLRALEEGEE